MQSRKIMVCDDDQGILDVLEMILEMKGYRVLKEIDSTKIIKRIKLDCPDLLLLDLWMPVISGDAIIKVLRSDPELRKIPVIVISASRDGEEIAMGAGADQFITKPFDMDQLAMSVENAIV